MPKKLVLAATLALQALTILPASTEADVFLLRARLEKVKEVPQPPPGPNEIAIDAVWLRTFRIEQVLIGSLSQPTVQDIHFSAQPVLGFDYYLLMEGSGANLETVWSAPVSLGLCIEPEVAKHYSIEREINDLKRQLPCNPQG